MVGERSLQGKGRLMSEVASNLHQLQKMEMMVLGAVGQPPPEGFVAWPMPTLFRKL